MANNRTNVPRCHECGKYMEKFSESATTVTYQCCSFIRTIPKPEERRRTKRGEWGYHE